MRFSTSTALLFLSSLLVDRQHHASTKPTTRQGIFFSEAFVLPNTSVRRAGRSFIIAGDKTTKGSPSTTRKALMMATGGDVLTEVEIDLVNFLDPINTQLNEVFRTGLNGVLEELVKFQATMTAEVSQLESSSMSSSIVEEMATRLQTLVSNFVADHPSLQPVYEKVQTLLQHNVPSASWLLSSSPTWTLILSSVVTYVVLSTLLKAASSEGNEEVMTPYPLQSYDPDAARRYFDQRPLVVLKRAFQITTQSLSFALGLLQDVVSNRLEENSEQRAMELAKLLTTLGPSFIKIGQSLSIRTDLLSPAYVRGLQSLQDQVPPFDSATAYQMLCDEWGVETVQDVVLEISPEPVAAASLGQVYRAKLRTDVEGVSAANYNENDPGDVENAKPPQPLEVAIKVQRPNIMEQIALDMHLLREFLAPGAKAVWNMNTDTVGTVDAWGRGFVDELNYDMEATNAERFMESMQTTPLASVVLAPNVVRQLSTNRVLTTEWINGERLDRSSQSDVTVLCSIAMNSYLTMMLETGLLHCDPHPGNLLRTPEGKLCILDWGMVTRLESELQLTLIEHMAHLTSADYEEIPKDLLLLGFIPPAKKDLIKDSGVVETLADIYGAWTKGGGAATINVNKVVAQLQDLTATKGNLFQIPPYFAYIAKSFSVLEGIGLSNDPKYSIINECLPYVSKRLLTDKSERTGGALSTFIFGPDKTDLEKRVVDYKRVEQLVTGFGNYTTSASGALLGKEGLSAKERLEEVADQVLDLIFAEDETPLQAILLEQMAKIVSSVSRTVWTQVRERSGTLPSGRTVLGTIVDPLGLWRTSPIVRVSDLDKQTVETTSKLLELARQQAQTNPASTELLDFENLSREELVDLSTILVKKVWTRRSGVLKTGGRFAQQLLDLTATKLEKGDRTGITLPEPRTVQEPSEENKVSSQRFLIPQRNGQRQESPRLQTARQRLEELTSQTPEAVPAKNRYS